MIPSAHKFGIAAAVMAVSLIGFAAPPKPTNAPPKSTSTEVVTSTFTLPKSPRDGRDPFFPNATSLYMTATPTKPVMDNSLQMLKLMGFLNTSYATINKVTLGVGETQEVGTPAGPVSVRLIEIKAQDESVVIEANGQRRTLTIGGKH